MTEKEFKPGPSPEREAVPGDSDTNTAGQIGDLRKTLHPCRRGCSSDALAIVQAGYFKENTVVVMCSTCQYATPILPITDAIERWSEENREKGYEH